jgi:hypothetical protein
MIAVKVKSKLALPGISKTFRDHSITANWKPKQIPRNGFFCSRAYLIAISMPSIPRKPNPPGTSMPLERGYEQAEAEYMKGGPHTPLQRLLAMHHDTLQD